MKKDFLQYLIPNFLKRLDFWLLTNKPHWWRLRAHYFLCYTLLTSVIFFLMGYSLPSSVYYLHDEIHKETYVYLMIFLSFLALGGVTWWWLNIQKFPHKSSSLAYFFTEISTYTLCFLVLLFSIFSPFWGYYAKKLRLDKQLDAERSYFSKHQYFKYSYVPHFHANKLDNLAAYFQEGEQISADIAKLREDAEQRIAALRKSKLDGDYNYSYYEIYNYTEISSNENFTARPISWNSLEDKLNGYNNSYIDKRNLTDTLERYLPRMSINTWKKFMDYSLTQPLEERIAFSQNGTIKLSYMPLFETYFDLDGLDNTMLFISLLSDNEQHKYLKMLNELAKAAISSRSYSINQLEYYQMLLFTDKFPEHIASIATNKYNINYELYRYDQDLKLARTEYNTIEPNSAFVEFINSLNAANLKIYIKRICRKYSLELPLRNVTDSTRNAITQYVKKRFEKPTLVENILFFDLLRGINSKQSPSIYNELLNNEYIIWHTQQVSKENFDKCEKILLSYGFPTIEVKDDFAKKILIIQQLGELHTISKKLKRYFNSIALDSIRVLISLPVLLGAIFVSLVFYISILQNGLYFWGSIFISGIYIGFAIFTLQILNLNSGSIGLLILSSLQGIYCAILLLYLDMSKQKVKIMAFISNSIIIAGLPIIFFLVEYIKSLRIANTDYIDIWTWVLLAALLLYIPIARSTKQYQNLPSKK